jgi:ABC-type Fe3+/spermidine/putrescine transport system ATPase subunit
LVSDATTPSVELEEIFKSYGRVEAVRGVSFTCRRGEFLTVLGPSGSGKTTILRMIAGFEQPTRPLASPSTVSRSLVCRPTGAP